ncbi:MAG: TonB-dependent receptor [Flavitalea sp.]
MKMTFILLTVAILHVSAGTLAQNVTISVRNAPLERVFMEIRKQSGYAFFFDYSLMEQAKKITLSVKNMPLHDALTLCFKDQPFTYEVVKKNIFLKLKMPVQGRSNPPEMPLIILPPPIEVHGRIINENGEPVVASIIVKGTNMGTTSNTNGEFQLNNVDEQATLVITATNIDKVEMKVNGKNELLINVKMALNSLNDIVVVGYGSQRKSDLTGSVSRIKGDDLKLLPTQRVDQALQGRAAGVMVLNTDGAPGGNAIVRIRGTNSINGDNNALVVIDGLQGGNLNSLNPNDIASIEILKDASATAIYGSQGANGVILITTKTGKLGKPVINYINDLSSSTVKNFPDLLNAADFAKEINKVRLAVNGNGNTPSPIFSDAEIDAFKKNGGTNWVDAVYRTAVTQNNQLSISGAGDKISYLLSGAYLNQQGVLKNSAYKRYTVRANVKGEINKWASFGVNLAWSKENANSALFGGAIDYPGNPIAGAIRFSPTIPIYDSLGNYSKAALRYANPSLWNPVASTLEPIIDNGTIRNNINAYLDFKILDGLTFRISGGSTTLNVSRFNFYNTNTYTGLSKNGSGQVYNENSTYFQNSNILTYDKTINRSHFTITAVGEQKFTKDFYSTITGSGFSDQDIGVYDLGGANLVTSASNYSERVINSYLGRVNYIFDNKYLLTASIRADGSSVFGSDHKWGYFPSGSVAWRASEESFVKDLNVFSDLKFRASYGVTGNQAINPYQTLAHINSGFTYPYFGTNATDLGFSITSTANPKLKWEKTAQADIGVDMSLLKGRLTLTADYYNKLTTDLLIPRELATYSGLASIIDNVGSIRNKGFEFSISADPIVGKFSWSTGLNFSANRAKVIEIGDADRIGFSSGGFGGQSVNSPFMYLVKGHPYGEMLGFGYLGVWKEKEATEAAAFGQLPGDPRYRDINGDGVIDLKDEMVIGNSMPKFTFGWNNRLAYGHFDLNLLITGSQGNDIFNITRIALESPGGTGAALLDRYSSDNQDASIPAIIDQQTRANAGLSSKVKIPGTSSNRNSRWVEDGSYVRLKNITFGYNLPAEAVRRIHFTNLRLYVSATNLVTITNYSGNDPEVSSYTGNDAQLGSDFNNYPQSRILNIGLNISF